MKYKIIMYNVFNVQQKFKDKQKYYSKVYLNQNAINSIFNCLYTANYGRFSKAAIESAKYHFQVDTTRINLQSTLSNERALLNN